MILKAEKSHNLPSANQRHRKTGGILQTQSEGLRIVWINGVSLSLSVGEVQCLSSTVRQSGFNLSWLLFFFLFMKVLSGLDEPTYTREGYLLYSVYWFKWYYLPEIPSQTHPELMFNHIFGHRVAQLSWHKINHHICTLQKCHSWKEENSRKLIRL